MGGRVGRVRGVTGGADSMIRAEINEHGPISFERFMELALYAPGAGYYTSTRDPFGKEGDFYTAEQVQPVFGILLARLIRAALAGTGSNTVVELGAGRAEMAPFLTEFEYLPIDIRRGKLPTNFSGVVFANEFFDALPVHLVERTEDAFVELHVDLDEEDRLIFCKPRNLLPAAIAAHLDRYHPSALTGSQVEVNLRARKIAVHVSRALECGRFIIIDYGYTAAEALHFNKGTLMSYRRHIASEDVLSTPGGRDITAHVAWTPLKDTLVEQGWIIESFDTLALALLRTGESDQFGGLFKDCDPAEEYRRRMQLKTLLFGMGETFRVLVASRALHKIKTASRNPRP